MASALSVVDDDPRPSGSPTRRSGSQGGGFGEEQEGCRSGRALFLGARVGAGLDAAEMVNNIFFIKKK